MVGKLKICGLRDPANIAAVAALQPDYMGFIFFAGSKRYVDNLSAEALNAIPESVVKTGVFVNEQLHQVQEIVLKYKLQAVQLHGDECPNYCKALKKLNPSVKLIKAFGVSENFDFTILNPYQGKVDFFLFDTQTPAYGGSGKLFDWSLLKDYTLKVPYFLSGGIGLENIEELQQLKDNYLYAIDVNSKFEYLPGLKDVDKLTLFKNQLFSLGKQQKEYNQ
jgi:phosphoribosylanthranilate isomerase